MGDIPGTYHCHAASGVPGSEKSHQWRIPKSPSDPIPPTAVKQRVGAPQFFQCILNCLLHGSDSDRAESRKARISVKDKKDRKGEKRGFSDRFKDKGTGRERSRERRLDNRSRFRDRGPMRERDRRGGRDRRIRNSRREGHRDKGSKLRSDGDSRRARPMRDRWGAKDDDDRAFDYIIPRNQLVNPPPF
eukprot:732002-Amorphochlora_amoeboformis.AAC.2